MSNSKRTTSILWAVNHKPPATCRDLWLTVEASARIAPGWYTNLPEAAGTIELYGNSCASCPLPKSEILLDCLKPK